MQRFTLPALFFILASGCAPEKEALSPSHASVSHSSELYAPAGFDWKTSRVCTLEVDGPKGMIEINAPDGTVLSRHYNAGGKTEVTLYLPNYIERINVAYAGVRSEMTPAHTMKLTR